MDKARAAVVAAEDGFNSASRSVASDEPEASIRGAAVFALEKLGITPAPLRFKKPLQPDAAVAKVYAGEIEKQAKLEERL